jgi:hypothetical protein
MIIFARIAHVHRFFPYARPYENLTIKARNARKPARKGA